MQLLIFFLLSWLFNPDPFSEPPFQNGESEKRIALSFESDPSFSPDEQDIAAAREIGITMLEFSDPAQIGHLPIHDFYILMGSPFNYLTIHQLRSSADEIIHESRRNFNRMAERYPGQIAAFSLFYHPADHKRAFADAASPIADSLASFIDKPFYYQSARAYPVHLPASLEFVSGTYRVSEAIPPNMTPVVHFLPSENNRESLQALERLLNQTLTVENSVVIIPAGWFFQRIKSQPDLAVPLSDYLNGEEVLFPLPAAKDSLPAINWSILLLFLIWGSFLFHQKKQPVFFGLLSRYFLNHTFFVNDIMENRIRSGTSGITILIQHCFISGLFFYTLAEILFSQNGYRVFSHHFPALFFEGFEPISFLLIGITAAIISHTVSVFWIFLLNKSVKHLNQAVNLYSWIFIINLLMVTLLVFLGSVNAAIGWTMAAAIVFILTWFLGFTIAAIDASRFLLKKMILNLLLTVGLHFALLAVFVLFLLFIPEIYEPVELAISMP